MTNVVFARASASVYVTFQDNLSGLAQATLINAGNYAINTLVNGKPGKSLSTSITTTASGGPTSPQQVRITFHGGRRIRRGQFLLTIRSGGIADVAGNGVDTTFSGSFPTGNGTSGGSFLAGLDATHNKVFALKPITNGSPKRHDPQRLHHGPDRQD